MTFQLGIAELCVSLFLDALYLFAFVAIGVLSVPFPRLRSNVLHAFTRNFWGNASPELDGRRVVWMHAVSVGESLACCDLMTSLCESRPDLQFVLSIGTSDGMAATLRERPAAAVFFAPFDFSWAVRRTFDAIRPVALVIAENDFWPNLLNEARLRKVPLAIFNTRMSPREQKEHRWNAWLLRPGLERACWWGTVTEQDAHWIRHFFGVMPPRLEVTGSLKFDGVVRDSNNPQTEIWRKQFGYSTDEQILVAGSTHSPEEDTVITLFSKLSSEFPQLRLVLVPRNVGRCGEIADLLKRKQVSFSVASQLTLFRETSAPVTLVDSVGILREIWGLADFAFVGGSLAPHGGQNLIEPASYGVPVCIGPHVWNFQSVVDEFLNAEAIVQVPSVRELELTLRHWLSNPDEARAIGMRGRRLVETHTRARDRTLRGIESVLPSLVSCQGRGEGELHEGIFTERSA